MTSIKTGDEIITSLRRRSVVDGECLRFVGASSDGYGLCYVSGKTKRVHRLAWEIIRGPIPEGLLVCHTCDVRDCWRIEHLFLGSHQENTDDMMSKGRGRDQETHCKWGHEFTPENTRVDKGRYRACRACQRERQRKR